MKPLNDNSIELSVLTGLLTLPDALVEYGDKIRPEYFSEPRYAKAYAALLGLFLRSESTDLLNLKRELIKLGAEDITPDLITGFSTPERMEAHTARLIDLYRDRRLYDLAGGLINRIGGGQTGTLDYAFNELASIADGTIRGGAVSFADIADEVIQNVEQTKLYADTGQPLPGSVSLGIRSLDNLTGGFFAGEMWIIAARPGMGKSTFARQIARNAARVGVPVNIISREMPAKQIARLIASHEAYIDSNPIRTGRSTEDDIRKFKAAAAMITRWPLSIDDRSATLTEIVVSIKKWRMRTDRERPAILVVDYLQLIQNASPGRNRESEVADVSRSLKSLAIDQNCLVIALSQLSRKVEERASKIPMLSDLRESGSIEQDADGVLFVYIPSRYDETANPNHAQVIVAKSRESQTGIADIHANMALGEMVAWDSMLHGALMEANLDAYGF